MENGKKEKSWWEVTEDRPSGVVVEYGSSGPTKIFNGSSTVVKNDFGNWETVSDKVDNSNK